MSVAGSIEATRELCVELGNLIELTKESRAPIRAFSVIERARADLQTYLDEIERTSSAPRAWSTRADGEEVNSPAGGDGTQPPPSENDEYAPHEYALPPAAKRLLRPRHSYVAPIIIFIVFGVVVLLAAIGISRLGPIEQRAPLQNEAPPPPTHPDRFSEQRVEPI